MNIQPTTNKQHTVSTTPKPNQTVKANTTEAKPASKTVDDFNITEVTKQITKALGSGVSEKMPAIDQKRVEAVKMSLLNKTYTIDAEKIAEKMIQMEQSPLDDSR